MERLRPSMQVYAINDQPVGEVRSTRNCCFEVELSGEQQERRSLTLPAIFNITPGEVTLICGREEMYRYTCPIHRSGQSRFALGA